MSGHKDIDPHGGKKFSSTYQPKEKWTEEVALKLGNDLVEWLKAKDDEGDDAGNIFYEEFLFLVCNPKDYHPKVKISEDTLAYLSKKFLSFSELIEKAKKIQKIKLLKYGVGDRLNAAMTKFVLINNHGMTDKQDVTNTNVNYSTEITPEEAKNISKALEDEY
jgi:hypothetical protein